MISLYIDGEAGAAGDMLLGALIDCGLRVDSLTDLLRPIVPAQFDIRVEPVSLCGIAAKRVRVEVEDGPAHRHLADVEAVLEGSKLSSAVRTRASHVFERLARAEAQVHSSTPETVHFHEVGANDAIIDIVGVMIGLETLGVEHVFSAPLVLGSGTGRSAHGPIHYPAPAVMNLLQGLPVRHVAGLGETTTPTGAAILAEVATFTEDMSMTPQRIGYGAGTRELPDRPNLLRATLGEVAEDYEFDTLWLVATDVDNTRPEVFEWVEKRLRDVGAVDVTFTDIGMKKGRHGVRVEALCTSSERSRVANVLLTETATLGVRWHRIVRSKLPRSIVTVSTEWGDIRVKVADTGNGPRAVPEYDDCRAAAERSGAPLLHIMETVNRLHDQQSRKE